jgi:CRP-like cAMP-binding protein
MNFGDPEWGGVGQHRNQQESLLDVLGRLAVFDTLTWQELSTIERIVHRRRFVTGEIVIQAFTPRSGLFAVVTGSVHVVRHLPEGNRLVLDTLGDGELLGEFALLDDSPRSTSIIAAEPSDLIGFFRSDLVDLIQTQPKMGFKILYRLAQIMAHRMQDVMVDLRDVRLSMMGNSV